MILLWLVALSSLVVGGDTACSNAPCAQTDYRSYSRCIQNQCANAVVATGCSQGGCASVYQPSMIPPPQMMYQQPMMYQPPPPPPPPMIIRAPPPPPMIIQAPPPPPPTIIQPQPIYQPQPQMCMVNMPYQQCPSQCPSCVYQPYQMGGYQSGCVPSPTWPFVRCPTPAMPMFGGYQGMPSYSGMQVMQQQPQQQQPQMVAGVPRG